MASLITLTAGTGTAAKHSDAAAGLASNFFSAKRATAVLRFRHETETIINS